MGYHFKMLFIKSSVSGIYPISRQIFRSSLPIPPYYISQKLSCLKTSKNVLSVLGLLLYCILY